MYVRWVKLGMLAAALGAAVWVPSPAAAQYGGPEHRPPRFAPWARGLLRAPMAGVRGGYDFATHSGSVGADIRVPFGRRGGLAVVPSGDLFFTQGQGHDWQLNLDGELRPFPLLGVYGGAGGALIHHHFVPLDDRETRLGWNLFAGLQPTLFPLRPFVETRWTFQGDHYRAFRLAAGVDLAFLRHRRGRGYPPPRDGRRGRPPRDRDDDD